MKIKTNLQLSDFKAFSRFSVRVPENTKTKAKSFYIWITRLLIITLVSGYFWYFKPQIDLPSVMIVMVFSVLLLYVGTAFKRIDLLPSINEGTILGEKTFVFEKEGFKEIGEGYEQFVSWSVVRRLGVTNDHLFIFVDKISGHMIPLKAAGIPEEKLISIIENFAAKSFRTDRLYSNKM